MTAYQVTARSFSTSSENRRHSDEAANRYEFKGALVPGVAVYGHLVKPFVDHFGFTWLSDSYAEVKPIKPTYDRDTLSIDWPNPAQTASITNQHGELLALLTPIEVSALPEDLGLSGNLKVPGRPEIVWDNACIGEMFSPRALQFSAEENARYCSEIGEEDSIYQELVHPHYLLSLAKEALMQEYQMPAWIHVKSKVTHRESLQVGNEVVLRSVVTDRWEKKGHKFIAIRLTFWHNDTVAVDVEHRAIFRIAE